MSIWQNWMVSIPCMMISGSIFASQAMLTIFRLLQEIVDLYQQKRITPIQVARILDAQDLEETFSSANNRPELLDRLVLKMPTDLTSLPINLTAPNFRLRGD